MEVEQNIADGARQFEIYLCHVPDHSRRWTSVHNNGEVRSSGRSRTAETYRQQGRVVSRARNGSIRLRRRKQARAHKVYGNDLAHLGPTASAEALDWFEADAARPRRVLLISSHGAALPDRFPPARDTLRRVRALGGVIGFSVAAPYYPTADALKADIDDAASLPFQGRSGIEGLALGTEFLGIDRTLPELGTVEQLAAWIAATFDPPTAAALLQDNARAFLSQAMER